MYSIKIPTYPQKLKNTENKQFIYDWVRKKFLILTPEEFVRQNIISYLINELQYPSSLIAVEMGIKVNQLQKRCDIVVYGRNGSAFMIIECKAPGVKTDQKVIDQIIRYNMKLQTPYLVISNGNNTFCVKVNYDSNNYEFLTGLPKMDQ